jgi:hypothetical protein
MGRLQDNLNNAKARLDFCEYELSEEVKAKKIALSKKLYNLLNNENFNNTLNIEDANICIECEYYDDHLEYYNPNCSVYLTDVFAYDPEESFVEDEDGNQHFFLEDLTLSEIENILEEIKDLLD